jgi:iron complex outermembrane recepter protein
MMDRLKITQLLTTAAIIGLPASVVTAQESTAEPQAELQGLEEILVTARINARFNQTTVSLFGKNLANEKGWTIGYDVQGIWSYAAPRPRRTWGVAVTQSF